MFCESAAPTPERVNRQRLATQILDEVTAPPSIPVSGQRPRMESVICPPAKYFPVPESRRSRPLPAAIPVWPVLPQPLR